MTDLIYSPGDNVGGLHLIRFTPIEAVQYIAGTTVSFKTGYGWRNAYCTPFMGSYEEKPDDTDPGTVYAVTVQGFWPGVGTPAERKQLDAMLRAWFVVETTDLGGGLRLIGTLTEPLTFSYRFRSGQAVGDRRGYELTWSGPLLSPPPLL